MGSITHNYVLIFLLLKLLIIWDYHLVNNVSFEPNVKKTANSKFGRCWLICLRTKAWIWTDELTVSCSSQLLALQPCLIVYYWYLAIRHRCRILMLLHKSLWCPNNYRLTHLGYNTSYKDYLSTSFQKHNALLLFIYSLELRQRFLQRS